ncbi:discoidin domain-containing protein [Blastopirellula marina]|nr:discoidin domain-containing protein [Blastopirellula marina]
MASIFDLCQGQNHWPENRFASYPSVAGSVAGNRVRFEKLVIPYATTYEHLQQSLHAEIAKWDRNGPYFLAYQVNIWKEMKPRRIVRLMNELKQEFPEQIEFVRADHFFNLSNQAHQLPFNLAMHPETQITASDDASDPKSAIDGTPNTLWTADANEGNQLTLDFGDAYEVERLVIRHAGAAGLDASLNSKSFTLKLSRNGTDWQTIVQADDNTSNVGDYEFPSVAARFARIEIDEPGRDDQARIADVELFGKTAQP